MDTDKIVDKKLVHWKKKLIDLSKRNNLVRYRFTKSKSLKIIHPPFEKIIEDLDHEQNIYFLKKEEKNPKERHWLCLEEKQEEKEKDIVEKKLYNLYLKAKENFQELGLSTCFVSLGMLKYKDSNDSDMYLEAPIFLYPVEISRLSTAPKDAHRFDIDSNSGEIQLNPALKEKLSHDFGIEINTFNEQTPREYLEQLRKTISGMGGWKINEDVYLDIFSYQKYIMYEDLTMHNNLVKNSSLVRAYVGDKDALQDEIAEFQREEFDDATSVDVLPADSSQKRAIELAKAGVTFVLQGPPGTGKSQTIANIISALIEKNRKILFVSQKMAALNVVQKRLDEVGLGRYCLNLHSYRGNKKEIIKQLMKELQTSPKISESSIRYDFGTYLQTQKDINEFYEFLCTKHSLWGMSIYDIRGELAKFYLVEIIDKPLTDTLKLNSKEFSSFIGKLELLDGFFNKIKNPLNNIFYNFKKEKNTTLSRNKFSELMGRMNEACKNLQQLISRLESTSGYKISTFKELDTIMDLQEECNKSKFSNTPSFFISKEFNEYKKLISKLNSILTDISSIEGNILDKVNNDFIKSDVKESEKVFKKTSLFGRIFNKDYKTHKQKIERFAKKKLKHSNWIGLFEDKEKLKNLNDDLDEFLSKNKKYCSLFGNCQKLDDIRKLNEVATNFSNLFDSASKIDDKNNYKITKFLFNERNKSQNFAKEIYDLISKINEFFEKDAINSKNEIEGLLESVKLINNNLNKLNDVLAFKEEFIMLSDEVKHFISQYISDRINSRFSDIFLKSYYLQMLDEILKKQNKLTPKTLIEKFRADDFKVRDILRYKIMDAVEKEQPKDNYLSSNSSEVYILKRENEKKRRLKPIRDLLEQIPNLTFALKPCFMMSPLTVSQYINPKVIKFDVVIFDEASQIMPEDAVPCLIRAKQTIVMGDTQQLPPTSFFLSQDGDEIEEEIEDLESFLSEASTKFRSKSLDWHYRSKNENLIAFSNRFFYENRLITFPNPKTKDKTGLDFVYLKNGVYDRGKSRKNRVEAREIVKIYRDLKKTLPKKSIGIIAFSIAQENAIREAFQTAGISIEESIDPHTEDLFIKNLETVQGDERDIIILSIGYGKDSGGKFSYHFGPLNKEGGYKRLNVSITRSRFKTIVVSSITPEELDEDKLSAEGTRYLKYYLDYAKNKDFTKFFEKSEGLQFDSTFEEAVYNTLIKAKFLVSSQVGCSGYRVDLAIKHPKKLGEYILGVECDGSQYHSSRFARDRDKIRQLVLESLGWNIHRIWSDDWLNNREYEVEKIKNKVKSILKAKGEKLTKNEDFLKVDEVEDFKEKSLKSKYKKYKVAELSPTRMSFEFDSYGNLYNYHSISPLKKRLMDVIEIEAPIEKELLFKRVLNSVGIQKLGRRLENLFEELLTELRKSKGIKIYDKTVSLEPIEVYSQVRISGESDRPFILIPKEELAGAIVDILKNTFSISRDGLTLDVAKGIYHNNRTGSKIRAKLDSVVSYLLKKGVIEEVNGRIKLIKK